MHKSHLPRSMLASESRTENPKQVGRNFLSVHFSDFSQLILVLLYKYVLPIRMKLQIIEIYLTAKIKFIKYHTLQPIHFFSGTAIKMECHDEQRFCFLIKISLNTPSCLP